MNNLIYDPLCDGGAEETEEISGGNSFICTNSSPPPAREAAYPRDSVLEHYMNFAREYSESEDSIAIGAVLPLVARLLGRRVFIKFGSRKYPNVYSVLVTKPGLRKSTIIRLVEKMGSELLPPNAFIGGATSEQALFKEYQAEPDRLLIEDEGNTVLSNWASDAAGKIVAKRFLSLYDCSHWQQGYVSQQKEGGQALQRINETSTSLLFGTTFNNCRFNGLETRDGMRRRVLYYLSEKFARTIYWPTDSDSKEFHRVVDAFRPLLQLEGVMELTPEARILWNNLQDINREKIIAIEGVSNEEEAYSSALSEEMSKVLKLAMLFEACRWAKDSSRCRLKIQRETLEIAAAHGRACLDSCQAIEGIGRRGEIRNEADVILAKIRTEFLAQMKDGKIELNRTQLTSRFAHNSGRSGAMNPNRLYNEIIPDLEKRGLANTLPKKGNSWRCQFSVEE